MIDKRKKNAVMGSNQALQQTWPNPGYMRVSGKWVFNNSSLHARINRRAGLRNLPRRVIQIVLDMPMGDNIVLGEFKTSADAAAFKTIAKATYGDCIRALVRNVNRFGATV